MTTTTTSTRRESTRLDPIENKPTTLTKVHPLVALACLSIFPLIYLIGSWIRNLVG